MSGDLPARLRESVDRTWSEPGQPHRGGYVLDDETRALLHEAADEIERVTTRADASVRALTAVILSLEDGRVVVPR